jgi:PAS domain S-box-containing protein
MTRDEHLKRELERLFQEWAVRTAPLGALIFLLIAPLDFISAPEHAVQFFLYRVAAAAGLLIVWRMAARAASPRALRAWLLAGVAIGAVAIELMILAHGGYRSAYNDGMILLAVTVLGLMPASTGFNLLLAGTIYTIFLAPLLLWGENFSGRLFFTQNYLIIAILAVMILIRHLHRSSMKREIGLAFDLTVNERQLERQVEERTAALVNASNEWRAAFDSTDDLMLMIDCEDRVVKANLATALFSGKDPRGLVGTLASDLLHHARIEGAQSPLAAVQRDGTRTAAEVRHDPSGRWFLATAEPIPEGRARAGGAVLTLRDITAIKAMEQTVTEARDDWQETFDSIQEGITIHDENFLVLRANAAARRMLGCADAEVEGIKCHELFHGLDAPIGGCPGCATLASGAPTTVDLYEPLLGRYLEVTTLPRADGGITHVVHDISERKQAMDELSRAAGRLQGILERAPFGVFIVNESFAVEFANPAMIAISGYPRQQFVGAFLGGLPGCSELGMATFVQAALEGAPFQFGPAAYHCHDGRRVVGRFNGIPIDEDGQRKVVVFVEDVTSLTNAEEERHRLNGLLLQAQKMESIGTLASGIAHDFNNILLAVIGLTDAAAEQLPADHMARPELEAVIGAAERGSELVQQLLAFGRKQELWMRPVDLRLLVEETRAMLVHVIPKKIDVAVSDSGDVPPVVADAVQIGQVLMNLTVNARDAMPDGGTLSIETSRVDVVEDDPAHPGVTSGDYVLLAVRDTGTGMSPEVRAKIFDPFFTTKEPGQGTGLGLATVYGIVSQHGGAVRVESEPGVGTAFFVYLPAAPGAKTVGTAPAPRGIETILLVENDALARQVIARKLAELGYRVLEAADGEQALRLLEGGGAKPDLLLCEIALPGIGARQIAGVARVRVATLRVVYISSHPESQLAQRGLLEPGDLLLSKALGAGEICRRLRDVLDGTVLT